ncbi:hypothetical protein [Flavobacterium algicola]|uniref:hypothetical protein n=1 Tax=Flavobacterium algicola TaxID=556529 RepID=UPI001EFE4F3D|nr:hypothetical protein [Flavobacterium algicola]MCG9792814.1 hypothetical protein [Flavobacterium algicola]
MFKLGQNVQQESGDQIMEVIDLEPGVIKNVITEWKDELGNTMIGKFSELQLTDVDSEKITIGS